MVFHKWDHKNNLPNNPVVFFNKMIFTENIWRFFKISEWIWMFVEHDNRVDSLPIYCPSKKSWLKITLILIQEVKWHFSVMGELLSAHCIHEGRSTWHFVLALKRYSIKWGVGASFQSGSPTKFWRMTFGAFRIH